MPQPEQLTHTIISALDALKAIDIQILNVSHLTSMTDTMIIASGGSDRQVRALARGIVESAREQGIKALGVEGMEEGEWVLVDFGDAIAHLMHPTTRAYYQLEKLWSADLARQQVQS